MKIIPNPIGFSKPLFMRRATDYIVIHHSASGAGTTITDINRWHLANGWSGIGYHYVIYPNGDIWRGRPETMVGAHAYQDAQHEANSNGIGICLIGNFETGTPTSAQMASLVWLIGDIQARYPKAKVIGHKDVMATACPGKHFPWAWLKERLEDDEMIYKTIADVPDWGRKLVQKLIDRKSLAGDGKGNINLPEATLKTLVILDREGVLK